jgi:lysophospholipase L1-like esterase
MNSILCLGDSYTIGEGVALHESFPYQLVQMLRADGHKFHAPEIVAKTGWTTFELKDHISHTILNDSYDFVTLLIGVNNQYRGLPIEEYRSEFELLLNKAINLVKKPKNVIVLSVPDWGVTPFAEGRDRNSISTEIDKYNAVNIDLSLNNEASYISITEGTRQVAVDETILTNDKLHYAAQEHKRWAAQVAEVIKDLI